MNAPSRPTQGSSSPLRPRRAPQRPLPGLPPVQDTPLPASPSPSMLAHSFPRQLVNEDYNAPFQLLECSPLSMLCTFHNVKRVSLEPGVPPPFKLDIPMLPGVLDKPDALLPTHILAVYDQGIAPEPSDGGSLSPFSASVPADPPSLPSTPILIPVNADLWSRRLTMALNTPSVPASPAESPAPSPSSSRRPSSFFPHRSSSPRMSRILSIPIIVLHVPSASTVPLFLLAALGVVPINSVAPALLPRPVLGDLPSAPAILAQQLLGWLYPISRSRPNSTHSNSERDKSKGPKDSGPDLRRTSISSAQSRSDTHSMISHGPLTPRIETPDSPDSRRTSTISSSSVSSSSSSVPTSPLLTPSQPNPDDLPFTVLTDASTASDPDMRLILLAQQNFGMWANSLALGARDSRVTHLVELAWAVAAEARRLRFGDVTDRSRTGNASSRAPRSRRSRTQLRDPKGSG